MPLYEYTCQECQHGFEALVFNGDTVSCPECQTERVERLLSLPAKPQSTSAALPMGCQGSGPPCGAAGGRRMQRGLVGGRRESPLWMLCSGAARLQTKQTSKAAILAALQKARPLLLGRQRTWSDLRRQRQ